ncbi:hypothetical protein BV898_16256 [Hypsibius exemplaris]|uniref:Lipocalin/cytosolic fatty-acid binding domain-containing protein n=1 Tax=Hypsibius exemplaris TaxID=2072580 RepID=A0A9X6ND83_HYPEX|nr:hypothetical protein BV898_16256 [Hypsibius exemplaris]
MARLSLIVLMGVVAVASASQPWLGSWTTTDKAPENWDQVVTALSLPAAYGGNPKSTLSITREGETYTNKLEVPSNNFSSTYSFKIGEEGTKVEPKFENTEIKYTFTEEGEKLLVTVKIPARGKEVTEVYEVTGDELVKTYKIDGIVAKRYLKRQAV